MINETMLKKLFSESAVFIEDKDVIPVYKAKEMFGTKIISKVTSWKSAGRYYNIYDNGEFGVRYITYTGFKLACTLKNMDEIHNIENHLCNDSNVIACSSLIGGVTPQ